MVDGKNRDKFIFLLACAGIFNGILFVDHHVILLNLCIKFWQPHLSLHVMCEASESVVAEDTCTLPKVKNCPMSVEGVRIEGFLMLERG